jgi:hypothetical protein
MDIFYIVCFISNKQTKRTLDYPKDFPLPNVGDEITMKEDGSEYTGVVFKKEFKVREYRELKIFVHLTDGTSAAG